MNSYQCWFCNGDIDRPDTGAVMITVEGLWPWDAGLKGDDAPWQNVYAHSTCAKDRLSGATMNIEPHIFGETDPRLSADVPETHSPTRE